MHTLTSKSIYVSPVNDIWLNVENIKMHNKTIKTQEEKEMKVGFVGLGIMGQPMARNVMKAGYDLTVFTLIPETIEQFKKEGAKGAANGKELAENVDVVILMLPNSPDVDEALFCKNGLAEGLSSGKAVIDMSSINPVESKRFAKVLAEKGVDFLDAPVSGGEPKAIDGTISVMVGGKEEVYNKYYDLIKSMAGSVVRVGDVALNIAALSEAFTLAKKAGVDPNLVYQAIRGGLAGSTVMDAKGPMMLEKRFDPGFRIDLHIKDLQNALDTAHSVEVSLPLTAGIMEILQALRIDGHGKEDHSAIVKYYENINKLIVGDN